MKKNWNMKKCSGRYKYYEKIRYSIIFISLSPKKLSFFIS